MYIYIYKYKYCVCVYTYIHPKETKSAYNKDMCTPIVVLFMTPTLQDQPRYKTTWTFKNVNFIQPWKITKLCYLGKYDGS